MKPDGYSWRYDGMRGVWVPTGDGFACLDCGVDTFAIYEFYMVLDFVWPLHRWAGMLCVGCLEERLGRELEPADFPRDRALNTSPVVARSERLMSRMGIAPTILTTHLVEATQTLRATTRAITEFKRHAITRKFAAGTGGGSGGEEGRGSGPAGEYQDRQPPHRVP